MPKKVYWLRYISCQKIHFEDQVVSTKQIYQVNKAGWLTRQAGRRSIWAGWIDVPTLTANIFIIATNSINKAGGKFHQSDFVLIGSLWYTNSLLFGTTE